MWIALLGQKDIPTDGVEDYCTYVGRALVQHGVDLRQVRLPWAEEGWLRALRWLWRESAAWRGNWLILQYTGFAWSRRGFPFGALAAMAILHRRGVRCAVVFHEAVPQPSGMTLRERFRGACQGWVIRSLYARAHQAIFTVPLETVSWLRDHKRKAIFIPIGANIPAPMSRHAPPASAEDWKTVIVFVVTGAPRMMHEVSEIAGVMREAGKVIRKLRLVAVGRGTAEAQEQLTSALQGSTVDIQVRGILPAEKVASELASADALLFVRGPIALSRGSALAGIASGLPIVGYCNGDIGAPLRAAGIECAPFGDRASLARALIRVLTDPARWRELCERNIRAHEDWFSWVRIGQRFYDLLGAARRTT